MADQFDLSKYKLNTQPINLDKYKLGPKPIVASAQPKQGFYEKNQDFLDPTIGAAKGAGSTLKTVGLFGKKILDNTVGRGVNFLFGKGFSKPQDTPADQAAQQQIDQSLQPTNPLQKFGKGVEQVAEFAAPVGAEEKVISAADKGINALKLSENAGKVGKYIPKFEELAPKLEKFGTAATKILKAAGRSVTSATSAAVVTKAQGGTNDQAKGNAEFAAAIPIVGKGLGKFFGGAANKIETSLLKPTKAALEDGFKTDNVFKYNLGGSLEDTISKSNQKMNELSEQLKTKLAGSNSKIDMNEIYDKVVKEFQGNKTRMFGLSQATQRALDNLKGEIENTLGKETSVDLPTAQTIKRAAGTMGSWVFGHVDADAKASEQVYSKFYSVLKKDIETNAPAGVKEINKQLSEIIPISNAAIRRLPIAERNSSLGLTDAIGLFASVGHPGVLPLEVANFLSKRGGTANILNKIAEPASAIGKKLLGK